MDLYEKWLSGKVQRMHTRPGIRPENIGEHTWGVMLLLIIFWPGSSRNLLIQALLHDFGEIATGDVPGHVKWATPELAKVMERMEGDHIAAAGFKLSQFPLTAPERVILEIVDRADFCMWAIHEMRLGNKNAGTPFNRSARKLEQQIPFLGNSELREGAGALVRAINQTLVRVLNTSISLRYSDTSEENISHVSE